MHRKFITLIIAAAIAVTGFSAPAHAGNKDVIKALAGLAILGVIGAAIHDSNKNQPVVSRRNTHPDYRVPPHRRHGDVKPRPMPKHVSRLILPGSCLRSFEMGRGKKTRVLGRQCMHKTYGFTQNLPRACAQKIWSPKGVRRGFNVSCLKSEGYRVSRN
ncbi:MAG: hypothetical protein ACI92Z_000971 [Paracoccaceae bacterium]|jgi:hypothetical protein